MQKKTDIQVLVLDDEACLAEVLVLHLKEAGYSETHMVTSEKEAFAYVRENGHPQIFITDFIIAGATNNNSIHIIETFRKKVPIMIGVTSFFDNMDVIEMMFDAGACEVDNKIHHSHLIETVNFLMNLPEKIDERNTRNG